MDRALLVLKLFAGQFDRLLLPDLIHVCENLRYFDVVTLVADRKISFLRRRRGEQFIFRLIEQVFDSLCRMSTDVCARAFAHWAHEVSLTRAVVKSGSNKFFAKY